MVFITQKKSTPSFTKVEAMIIQGQVGDLTFVWPKRKFDINNVVTYLESIDIDEAWFIHAHEVFHSLGFVKLCALGSIIKNKNRWKKNDHLAYINDVMSNIGSRTFQ